MVDTVSVIFLIIILALFTQHEFRATRKILNGHMKLNERLIVTGRRITSLSSIMRRQYVSYVVLLLLDF